MTPPPASLLERALRHQRAGQLAQATRLYEQILQSHPQHADALGQLALIVQRQGDTARAEILLVRALALRPNAAPLHLHHGLALRALRRPDDALAAFRRALALDPSLAEAHHQAGNLLKNLGRFAEAIAALRDATRLAPAHAAAWLNLGVACLEGGARDEAIAAFRRAVTLEPRRAEAQNILGVALLAAGQLSAARTALTEALRLRPGDAAAHDNLGRLCKAEGLLGEAVAHYRAALAAKPDPATHSNLLLALNYVPDLDPGEIFAEHRRWNQLHAAPLANLAPETAAPPPHFARPTAAEAPGLQPKELSAAPPPRRRLRVGYVSPDFVHHSVAYFIEPVLAAHDRSRVEVFCYAHVRAPDRVTDRLRDLAEHWREIALLDDATAADLIRRDELDLLIDLAGHTAHHRLLVFARRPAPVQATWIGYPNTTGLDAIDFRITDSVSDPVGQTEDFHSEKLIRLPATFSCYRPDENAPPVNPLPATTPGAVTFGCFNNFTKISPPVVALWTRLLRELPAARLLLKSRGLGDPGVAARLHAAFAAAGVPPERIALNADELSVPAHLGLYHGVDLALDPFPYNGTTTTCEALWMGVPVITLAGQTHVARVGASLLTHTGLADWVAATPDDYVARAVAAAHDLPRLAGLRRTLREPLRASPLCDAARFTRGWEEACEKMAGRQGGGSARRRDDRRPPTGALPKNERLPWP